MGMVSTISTMVGAPDFLLHILPLRTYSFPSSSTFLDLMRSSIRAYDARPGPLHRA